MSLVTKEWKGRNATEKLADDFTWTSKKSVKESLILYRSNEAYNTKSNVT